MEDDFDELVQQDAKSYSADKKWHRDQANVKSQNKTLKAAGKKLLKPPPKPAFLLPRPLDDEDDFSSEENKKFYRRRETFTSSKLPMEGRK